MVDRLAVLLLFLFLFLPFVIKAQGNRVAIYHTVQQDEWNSKIAHQYQTKVDSLEKWNPNVNSNSLKVGQRIIVGWQEAEIYHIVQSGDTYSKIARQYQTNVDSLLKWNPDVNPTRLMVGRKIIVGWQGTQSVVDKPQPNERPSDEEVVNLVPPKEDLDMDSPKGWLWLSIGTLIGLVLGVLFYKLMIEKKKKNQNK
jgi:LysM repeat protein